MTESLIHTEVDRLLAACDGDLTTRSRVIDGLLDLRAACASRPLLVAVLDRALRNAPGRNVVETEWWKNELRGFAAVAELALVVDDREEPAVEPIWAAI